MIRREVRIENHVVLNVGDVVDGPVSGPAGCGSVRRPSPAPQAQQQCWRAASPDRSPPAGAGPGVRVRARARGAAASPYPRTV